MIKKESSNSISFREHDDYRLAIKRIYECNVIKYAAYRTAAKLRVMQRSMFMDHLRLGIIAGVFERYKLQSTENSVFLDHSELEDVVSDMFFVVQKEILHDLNVDVAADLVLTFLFNVFDSKKQGTVQVLDAKVGLVVLCQSKPREKYQYLFSQLSDHNNCLSRKKLEILLKKTTKITGYLSETLSFGTELVQGTVESCFKSQVGTIGVSEENFISWLLQDPQLLVWISTLYRMQIAEIVCHGAKCNVCKIYPIVGLRYRCLQCLSYNQCQTCFFTGRINKKHKAKHPVQEYCCQITSKQSTRAFLTTLKNKLTKTSTKLQYLPAYKTDVENLHQLTHDKRNKLGDSTRLLDEMEVSTRTVLHGSRVSLQVNPTKELQSIIFHLEQENKQLQMEIENMCSEQKAVCNLKDVRFKDCLQDHRVQLASQVQRLKLLKHHISSRPRSQLESTPLVTNIQRKQETGLRFQDKFSPITRNEIMGEKKKNLGEQKLIWDKYDMGYHINNIPTKNTSWEEVNSTVVPNKQIVDTQDDNLNLFASGLESRHLSDLSTFIGSDTLKSYHANSHEFSWLEDKPDEKVKQIETKTQAKEGSNKVELEELQDDLEEILDKLQNLLANNFNSQDDATNECTNLEIASTEVENILSDLIQGVEMKHSYSET